MSARDVIANHIKWYTLGGEAHIHEANAILSALESAGYVVVKKEPTEEMEMAGLMTVLTTSNGKHMSPATIYRAMLSAAKEAGE